MGMGREIVKEDEEWMHKALKALLRTKGYLHSTARKKTACVATMGKADGSHGEIGMRHDQKMGVDGGR